MRVAARPAAGVTLGARRAGGEERGDKEDGEAVRHQAR
jgi:hypothetical protein